MVTFAKRNIFALLMLLASVDFSANGVGFWCDTDKYDCDRHSSGIEEKNAVSVPAPSPALEPTSGAAPGTDSDGSPGAAPGTYPEAPSPFIEDGEDTIDSPEVIDSDGEDWDPIDPPEIVDEPGKDGAPTPAPGSEDDRRFPVLPFVAIAAGGGFLISLFFYLRRRQGPSEESAAGVDESAMETNQPDVTP